MSHSPAVALPRLHPAARSRRFAGWLAAFALLVATLAPQWQALSRPAADDPFASLCVNGGAEGGAGSHPFGNACVLCTLAHSAPELGGGAPRVATLEYAPPEVAAPQAVAARPVQARAPTARAPPSAG